MGKNQLAMVFALAAMAVQAQTEISVRGTAPAQMEKVYVWNNIHLVGIPIDSATVTDGKWTIKREAGPNHVMLAFYAVGRHQQREEPADGQVAFAMADSTPTEVNLTAGTVKGSKASEALNATLKRAIDIRRSGGDAVERHAVIKKAILDNTDSMLPAVLVGLADDKWSYRELKALLKYGTPYYYHSSMDHLKMQLYKQEPLYSHLDRPFADFTMPDTEGKERRLSEWCGKGRYVLVDFWASWCGPCRKEMPNVVACYNKYHDKGFDVVGVSFDQNKDAWLKSIETLQMPWPHLSDLKGWECAAAKLYGIYSIPGNLLIDGDGIVVDINLRGDELGRRLEEIFKEK